jgi:indole-3-glycerol phosphate synthase
MALAKILELQQQLINNLPDISADLAKSDRDFLKALQKSTYKPAVIAELKPKSPSVGVLAQETYQPALQAQFYEQGGAAALSILTETHYFGGKFEDLTIARAATTLPVLCKDFIISPKQVKLARQAGADAVLLIVAALSVSLLAELKKSIESFNMLAVIEVHTLEELTIALTLKPQVILINNRNLFDLSMHKETTVKLLPHIPDEIPVISASGFSAIEEIKALAHKVDGVLIGTHLMQQGDPRAFLRGLA